MFLVVGSILSGEGKDRSTNLGSGQLVGCKAISPDAPMLEEKGPVQYFDVVELVLLGHAVELSHLPHPPCALARCTCGRPIRWAHGHPEGDVEAAEPLQSGQGSRALPFQEGRCFG